MVTSGIPSARKKLERARFHLDALHTEVRAFRDHSPYEFDSRSLGNEPGSPDFRVTVKVTDAPPIPDTWPLITGDILTNVRAALDHAVFPHVQATDPDEKPWRIQYPIEDTDTRFEDKSGGWFAGDVRDAGERSQLYRDEDGASRNPLRMLRVLVNMDKHRDLVLANYSIDDFVVPPHDLYKVVSATVNSQKWCLARSSRGPICALSRPSRANTGCSSRFTSTTGRTSRYPAVTVQLACWTRWSASLRRSTSVLTHWSRPGAEDVALAGPCRSRPRWLAWIDGKTRLTSDR